MEKSWDKEKENMLMSLIKRLNYRNLLYLDEIKSRAGNIVTLDYSTGYGSSDLYSMITNTDKGAVQVLFNADEKFIEAMRHMRPSIVKR